MAMYDIGSQPLLRRLDGIVKQLWYAHYYAVVCSLRGGGICKWGLVPSMAYS